MRLPQVLLYAGLVLYLVAAGCFILGPTTVAFVALGVASLVNILAYGLIGFRRKL